MNTTVELTKEEIDLLKDHCGCCNEQKVNTDAASRSCACCGGPSESTYCSMSCSAKAKVGMCQ